MAGGATRLRILFTRVPRTRAGALRTLSIAGTGPHYIGIRAAVASARRAAEILSEAAGLKPVSGGLRQSCGECFGKVKLKRSKRSAEVFETEQLAHVSPARV